MCEPSLLTDSDCAEILHERFRNPYITPSRTELHPFSKEIQGLASTRYVLKIFYKLDDLEQHESFFVKSIHMGDPSLLSIYTRAFQKEEFFYKTLVKKFSDLGLDTSFAPKCFLARDGELLVLENLENNNFKTEERAKFYDTEQLRSCLDSLAAFHACSFIYELKTGKKLDVEYPEEFREYFFDENEELPTIWFDTSIPLWSKLSEHHPQISGEFKKLIDQTDCRKMFKEATNYRKITGHGDSWSKNIMFKRLNTKRLKANLIDYQLLRYSYPAFDVLLAILFNCSFEQRQECFSELVDYYYEQLAGILSKHGCRVEEVLSKSELLETIEVVRFAATLQYASCFTLIMMPESILSKIAGNFQGWVKSDRYEDIKNAMDVDEDYKKVIMNCLKDLEVALLGKGLVSSQNGANQLCTCF